MKNINNLSLHFSKVEKEQFKHNPSRRKETVKIRVEINESKKKKTNRKKINRTKTWFFDGKKKINKMYEPLPRQSKKKKKDILSQYQKQKEVSLTTENDNKILIKEHYKQYYAHLFDNTDGRTKSLKT